MKQLVGLLTIVSIGLGTTACGSTVERARPASPGFSNSTTTESAAQSNSVLDFGQAANPIDRQAVTVLVKRYYAAAAAEDGATACSLVLSSVAKSVPEDYAQAPGPLYLRGSKTCQTVMSRLFTHSHRRMATESATLEVTRVRLKSKGGYAVLRFKTPPEREINVVREGNTWKVASLLDSQL